MNEKKNVLIGKIGKCMKFKGLQTATGDDAIAIFYSSLSRLNPEYDFWICGPNQLSKLTQAEYDLMFPNHNVHSAHKVNWSIEEPYSPILDFFKEKGITVDFGLLMVGMCGERNIPNFIRLGYDHSQPYSKTLGAYKLYSAPYLYVLNRLGCPYFTVAEDPRYVTINAVDLYNHERLIFTQMNGDLTPSKKRIKSEMDWTREAHPIKCVYAGTEKIFLTAIDPEWRQKIDIERKLRTQKGKFIVISNGCGTAKLNAVTGSADERACARLPEYEKWILNNFKGTPYEDTVIYGKWGETAYQKWPEKILNIRAIELQEQIADAKYSMCYSQIPGFVTTKCWELITLGIIPFLHPDYDPNRLLGLPEYLYLEKPEDLVRKCGELDADPEKHKALLKECMDLMKPEWFDGSELNNRLFGTIADELGFAYEEKKGLPPVLNHWNDGKPL